MKNKKATPGAKSGFFGATEKRLLRRDIRDVRLHHRPFAIFDLRQAGGVAAQAFGGRERGLCAAEDVRGDGHGIHQGNRT